MKVGDTTRGAHLPLNSKRYTSQCTRCVKKPNSSSRRLSDKSVNEIRQCLEKGKNRMRSIRPVGLNKLGYRLSGRKFDVGPLSVMEVRDMDSEQTAGFAYLYMRTSGYGFILPWKWSEINNKN